MDHERWALAMDIAAQAHDRQTRTRTKIPYLSHPLAVAALVMEFGGTQDQAMAGLLHDTLEDGGPQYAQHIEETLGKDLLEWVIACSDPPETGKPTPWTDLDRTSKIERWRYKKEKAFERLKTCSEEALLICGCDKLHNLRSIAEGVQQQGAPFLERFVGRQDGVLWYYQSLGQIFHERKVATAGAFMKAMKDLTDTLGVTSSFEESPEEKRPRP